MTTNKTYEVLLYLDLVSGDADSLGDELFLNGVWVAHGLVDTVQHLQLVARVGEALLGRRRGQGWRRGHYTKRETWSYKTVLSLG